jgi:hypothetical protein
LDYRRVPLYLTSKSVFSSLSTIVLVFINSTRGFYCDYSIDAYSVLLSLSPFEICIFTSKYFVKKNTLAVCSELPVYVNFNRYSLMEGKMANDNINNRLISITDIYTILNVCQVLAQALYSS